MSKDEHCLYRHFAADGQLLYIGSSWNPMVRLQSHRNSPWYGRITRMEIERFPDSSTARKAERQAIHNEKPLHNKPPSGGKGGNGGRLTADHVRQIIREELSSFSESLQGSR